MVQHTHRTSHATERRHRQGPCTPIPILSPTRPGDYCPMAHGQLDGVPFGRGPETPAGAWVGQTVNPAASATQKATPSLASIEILARMAGGLSGAAAPPSCAARQFEPVCHTLLELLCRRETVSQQA